MTGFSKIILVGNLTKDPEMHTFKESQSVKANLRLAVNGVPYKDSQRNKQTDVSFIDVEAWGKNAETMEKYLKKGDPILVEGKLGYNEWSDKTSGDKRSKLFVRMQTFSFMPTGNGNGNSNSKPQNAKNTVVEEDLGESSPDDFDPLNF